MMRVVNQQVPTPFRDIDLGTLLRPNLVDWAKKGALMPLRAARLARQMAGELGSVSVMDLALGLAEGLPSGVYSGSGIEKYVRTVLSDPDRSDDFRMLENELYLAATDLDTCERIVFGAEGWDDIAISTAARASGSSGGGGAGTARRSRPRCAPRPRYRWSTSPFACASASSSTAA